MNKKERRILDEIIKTSEEIGFIKGIMVMGILNVVLWMSVYFVMVLRITR